VAVALQRAVALHIGRKVAVPTAGCTKCPPSSERHIANRIAPLPSRQASFSSALLRLLRPL